MSGLVTFLGTYMVNPALFMLGVAAISSPIIIHLLNKRKFKRVDWAAMDFLLEADKKNRRRVRLENLILLLLRCLACILIGALLARIFWPRNQLASLLGAEEFERIVLVDNSLSMSVKDGSSSSLQNAKSALADFVMGLSGNGSSDTFTLYTTSNPEVPLINGTQVDNQGAAAIVADIDEVQVSDRRSDLAAALLELEKALEGKTGSKLNQVVYVVSDMRKADWPSGDDNTDEEGVMETLKRIADATSGCFLVDIGREDDVGNIYVEEIRCKEKSLVAGVPADFDVTLRNTGRREAKNVKVQFAARFQDGGEIPPIEESVESIAPGESQTVPFKFAFSREELEASELGAEPARIEVKVVPPSEEIDELEDDNKRFFAARVAPGLRTLIVDGDILPDKRDSESFFLAKALSPPGDQLSGMAVDVVGEGAFETVRLEDYQVIYLCNVFRIPEPGEGIPSLGDEADEGEASEPTADTSSGPQELTRRQQLERWVAAGGGLVIAMGERIDEDVYNEEMYRGGKGLLPMKLDTIKGAVDETSWSHFNVKTDHPVMHAFYGDDGDAFAEFVKIFRFWDCTIAEEDLSSGRVNVIATFDNTDASPAVVEQQYGDGRVLAFATPIDTDWNDWPQDHSFVPSMLELNKYMARQTSDDANVGVGDPLEQDVDLSKYELEFRVTKPDATTKPDSANPPEGEQSDQVFYQAKFDEVDERGFYQLVLNRREAAGPVPLLFAANIDPFEGDLARADVQQLQRKLGDSKVSFISAEDLTNINIDDARIHLWPLALALLVGVLALEQFLGWRFGRNR